MEAIACRNEPEDYSLISPSDGSRLRFDDALEPSKVRHAVRRCIHTRSGDPARLELTMNLRRITVATLALFLAAGTALAQPKKAELEAAKKEAIAIADKGVEAYRGEKYQDAIDAFQKADQKFHVPKFLLYVARAQAKLGKLLQAKATYQSIVDEKLAQYAPDEFFTAQNDAKKELAELEKRIPAARIELNGVPTGETPSVTLDGAAVAATDLGKSIGLDPGRHVVTVTLAGRAPIKRDVDITEGRSQSIVLEVSIPPPPASGESGTADATSASDASELAGLKQRGGVPGLAIAMYSIGGAGLLAGAVFGGLTLGKYNDYNAHPTKGALDDGRAFGLVTDIGLGVTLVGAALGTVFLLTSRPADPSKAGAFIMPVVSPTSGGMMVRTPF
ncbi:MAG: hypothetical protein U0441_36465 [Polyangiaceae bacterium]